MVQTMRKPKTSLRQMNNIEVLLERLRSLQIMNKASEKTYKQSNEEMFVVQVPATMNDNTQAIILKSIISDLGWFDEDWTKFEDW